MWTKEQRNEYQKKYNKNSDSYKEYQKKYYKENKEKWKDYKVNRKGYYIYMFIDENGQVVYVGKTLYIDERMSRHKSTKQQYEEGYTVLYKKIDGINDAILEDIEAMLIEVIQPVKNVKNGDYDGNVDKYLNKKIDWKEYKM